MKLVLMLPSVPFREIIMNINYISLLCNFIASLLVSVCIFRDSTVVLYTITYYLHIGQKSSVRIIFVFRHSSLTLNTRIVCNVNSEIASLFVFLFF